MSEEEYFMVRDCFIVEIINTNCQKPGGVSGFMIK